MVVKLLPILWIFVTVIALQYSNCLNSARVIRSNSKVITEVIELNEETPETYLNCSTDNINGTQVKIEWEKDGVIIPELRGSNFCPIFVAACHHDGKYTCFTNVSNSKIILKIFVVKIIETQDNSACGIPGEELVQQSEVCIVPTVQDFQCCHHSIPPPGMLHLSQKISSNVSPTCKLGTLKNPKPWQIGVKWTLTHNATWIWGWQVSIGGLDNAAGFKSCVQINSKSKLLNWTFDGLPFGSKYVIKVQALPSDLTNYIIKTIVLPRKKDICKSIGRNCHWEICFPVKDVKQEEMSSVLTWRLSKYHKTQQAFEIYYNSSDSDCIDSGIKKVQNKSRIDLNIHRCQHYNVKVRPIFSNGEKGTFSKAIEFYLRRKPTKGATTRERYIDVIVSCTIAVGLLILGFIAAFLVKRKRKVARDPGLLNTDVPEVIPNPAHNDKLQVFIVHYDHCRMCKDVTHALANLLDGTGYVECVVDFCCDLEIKKRGMGWYEEKIKCSDKTIVVCTKDGKKSYDEKKGGPYTFLLNMMLAQMMNHPNRRFQVVPVYFDISSDEDVPFFLGEYECHTLPSHLRNLCSALRSEINVNSDTSNDVMYQHISNLKNAIEFMGQNHKGYRKLKLTKTTSL